MPARDGTGPNGQGKLTGRGFGFCEDNMSSKRHNGIIRGLGRRLRLGRCRGLRRGRNQD
jgi:hypothetical protein